MRGLLKNFKNLGNITRKKGENMKQDHLDYTCLDRFLPDKKVLNEDTGVDIDEWIEKK
jgi:hypothetical protein